MDIRNLLELLNENSCKYLVIGALAFPHYGYARATLDIDIFIEPSPGNADKVHHALDAFGFDVSDIATRDLLDFKLLIRDYALQLDVHPFVTGVEFDNVWSSRVQTSIKGIPVWLPSLEDLIVMKKAAGRQKDLEDLRYLERLRDRT